MGTGSAPSFQTAPGGNTATTSHTISASLPGLRSTRRTTWPGTSREYQVRREVPAGSTEGLRPAQGPRSSRSSEVIASSSPWRRKLPASSYQPPATGFQVLGDDKYCHVVTLEYLLTKLGTLGVPLS